MAIFTCEDCGDYVRKSRFTPGVPLCRYCKQKRIEKAKWLSPNRYVHR